MGKKKKIVKFSYGYNMIISYELFFVLDSSAKSLI